MKNRAIWRAMPCCIGAAMLISGPARANYQGLSTSLYSSGVMGGQLRHVIRVYAVFSNPNDYLTAVAGSDVVGPMMIQSRNSDDSGPGGNFFNPIPSQTAPTSLQVYGGVDGNGNPVPPIPNAEFETFCTIGVAIDTGIDETELSPSPPTFISGTSLTTNNFGWFCPCPIEQGRAGTYGDLKVLMMQLTVTGASGIVKGTVSASGVNAGALASSFTANGQTFSYAYGVPGPAGLSAFALAGMLGTRSRRRAG